MLEDDPNLAKSLIKYLQRHDYEVDWAKQGEEAIDLSYDNSYDLYLFDVNVPLVSGTEVLSELREADDHTPARKEVLMELLTTHNDGALRVNIAKLKKETGLQIEAVRGVGYQIL